ncbi:MAG TPA: hypothetical protein VJN44_12440, partial [Roseateles sp.]|nr:hypothetical protein [Roseateles sp.]
MAIERWGSLSVADHIDAGALAANVLLYDRLVLPVMSSQPDRDEQAYWERQGWNPELQRRRLEQLEELAVCRPWNAARRARFRDRLSQLRAERFDAQHIDSHAMARRILAQEQVLEKLAGVQHVDVIAAYNSAAALSADFHLDDLKEHVAAQAGLLTRRLAVPDLADADDGLRLACELSRDAAFRERRAALFDWQELMADKKLAPEAAVDLLCELTDAYNEAVLAAKAKVRWKLAFTVFGIGLG